jgi:hypothetical protein
MTDLFADKESIGFYGWLDEPDEKGLERIVFQVSKKPPRLQGHLERIYYCFQQHLSEQLYGALVDLLIILNRGGNELSRRMLYGCKSRLSQNNFQALANHLDNKSSRVELLPPCRYSVFSKGTISVAVMVSLRDDQIGAGNDPLILARDYIKYSQLDAAASVLTEAILTHPERLEVHHELLALFRSTRNKADFVNLYDELSKKGLDLPAEWQELSDYFGL